MRGRVINFEIITSQSVRFSKFKHEEFTKTLRMITCFRFIVIWLLRDAYGPSDSASLSLFHSIVSPVRLGLDTRDGPLRNGVKGLVRSASDAPSDARPCVSQRQNSPIGLRCPTHQPIELSSMEYLATFTRYLAMFTRLRSHTRIVAKGNLFDFAMIFTCMTNSTKLH